VRFDDAAADPKTHTDAVGFGREKGIKYLIHLLPWQSHTVIAHRDD
jgi:hypothetical protein